MFRTKKLTQPATIESKAYAITKFKFIPVQIPNFKELFFDN